MTSTRSRRIRRFGAAALLAGFVAAGVAVPATYHDMGPVKNTATYYDMTPGPNTYHDI